MAKPFLLWENVLEDGTLTVTTAEPAGNEVVNVTDWRWHSLWVSGSTIATQNIDVDLGVGVTASPDTVIIGGHNFGTVGATFRAWHSDDGAAWTAAAAGVAPTDDTPYLSTWTGSAHRYWRLSVGSPAWATAPEIGVVTFGRRHTFDEGSQPGFDPYGQVAAQTGGIGPGSFVRPYVTHKIQSLQIEHDSPGMTKSAFFRPSSGLGFDADFVPHAIESGKPFWFVWNTDEEAHGAAFCRTAGVSSPAVGSYKRRSLVSQFTAYLEVA